MVNSTAFESDDMKMGSKLEVELSETSFTAGSAPVMIASSHVRSDGSGAVCCGLWAVCWAAARAGGRTVLARGDGREKQRECTAHGELHLSAVAAANRARSRDDN